MLLEFSQTKKDLYSADFNIICDGSVIGNAFLNGNMSSVFADWNIQLCDDVIHLRKIRAKQAAALVNGLTGDKPFGAMEIIINGESTGVVFQGTHKKSFFREYSVHHVIYNEKELFSLYPIGFGKEGSKSPVYLETGGKSLQVAQINKDSTVHDDLHVFRCYVSEQKHTITIVLFCALMYTMGCYRPGEKTIKGTKTTCSVTLEKELLSKYDPLFEQRVISGLYPMPESTGFGPPEDKNR